MYARIFDLPEGIVNDLCHLALHMPHDAKLELVNPVFKFLSELRDAVIVADNDRMMRRRAFLTGCAETPAETHGVAEGK